MLLPLITVDYSSVADHKKHLKKKFAQRYIKTNIILILIKCIYISTIEFVVFCEICVLNLKCVKVLNLLTAINDFGRYDITSNRRLRDWPGYYSKNNMQHLQLHHLYGIWNICTLIHFTYISTFMYRKHV